MEQEKYHFRAIFDCLLSVEGTVFTSDPLTYNASVFIYEYRRRWWRCSCVMPNLRRRLRKHRGWWRWRSFSINGRPYELGNGLTTHRVTSIRFDSILCWAQPPCSEYNELRNIFPPPHSPPLSLFLSFPFYLFPFLFPSSLPRFPSLNSPFLVSPRCLGLAARSVVTVWAYYFLGLLFFGLLGLLFGPMPSILDLLPPILGPWASTPRWLGLDARSVVTVWAYCFMGLPFLDDCAFCLGPLPPILGPLTSIFGPVGFNFGLRFM